MNHACVPLLTEAELILPAILLIMTGIDDPESGRSDASPGWEDGR
jgi:hypothetical protein